jgi:hypothetical protein
MEQQKKVIIGMLILTVFILIVAMSSLYVQTQIESGNICGCVIPLYLFIPLLASIGLFIGTLVYYLISPRFETRAGKDAMFEFLLKGLPLDERKIMEMVLKKPVTQAKLVRETGLDKVKVFRIVKSLQDKGLVVKEKHGKTNMIKLSDDIKEMVE